MKNAIGIFAKTPVAGQVKTRLCPPLSGEEALALYRTMLDETVEEMGKVMGAEVILFVAGDEAYFAERFPQLRRIQQQGSDLGQRMATAITGLLDEGYTAVVLVGSDNPDLPPEKVDKALMHLRHVEVVFCPATDGGYVLIGESRHNPEIFVDMPWSTDKLVDRTRQRLMFHGLIHRELETWDDIDDAASLERLLERTPKSRTATHVRQQLSHHFWQALKVPQGRQPSDD